MVNIVPDDAPKLKEPTLPQPPRARNITSSEVGFLIGLLFIMLISFLFYFALPTVANSIFGKARVAEVVEEVG